MFYMQILVLISVRRGHFMVHKGLGHLCSYALLPGGSDVGSPPLSVAFSNVFGVLYLVYTPGPSVQSWFTPAWLSVPRNTLLIGPQAVTVVLGTKFMSPGSMVQEMVSVLAPAFLASKPSRVENGNVAVTGLPPRTMSNLPSPPSLMLRIRAAFMPAGMVSPYLHPRVAASSSGAPDGKPCTTGAGRQCSAYVFVGIIKGSN